uniref:Uncharacterized protein n=1 Tax=Rhizophora mucronata TaxID=61149 RepID=A0A2P2MEZ3_RHIMU
MRRLILDSSHEQSIQDHSNVECDPIDSSMAYFLLRSGVVSVV